ncbi:tetratricopeptide repeat protein [Tellurirhabdus rosea]|uniref:tetratricopeptide repeat protein n=1 Tax=Tellurirhabdus rosea TaxID=2674997 RepID=UPI002258E121|nr:hypothetical protein [Tellurirhabdus rosea]
MKKPEPKRTLLAGFCLLVLLSCQKKNDAPTHDAIEAINLKRGEVVICGTQQPQFGSVRFAVSAPGKTREDFNLAMALLHSFEYDEAEKVFAGIIDKSPDFAMAYWGVAMCNYHPLWAPPTPAELEKGTKAVTLAQKLADQAAPESAYIDAIARFYQDYPTVDHRTRSRRFETAMEQIHRQHPADHEAVVFYALALVATADPADKTLARQKKAGALLNGLYQRQPDHPGIVHYLIHAFDSPQLAPLALPAARRYASLAPSSAHALHMPSHIFVRLGLWTECIASNQESVSAARCYAQSTGIRGHWDEELHGLDYLMYAHLQRGDNAQARKQWAYLQTIREVHPASFKVAYAFAAIPGRYVLENRLWPEAARLKVPSANFSWNDFPWQNALIHYTRLLGWVHTDRLDSARAELKTLYRLRQTLLGQKDDYKANQIQIQILSGEAWILHKEGKSGQALRQMQAAANLEDKTAKHPVTPGELLPARELLGDMLLEMNKPREALRAYEADLQNQPNRFNGLYGASMAAKQAGDDPKATHYARLLVRLADAGRSDRAEVKAVRGWLPPDGPL